MKRIFSVFVCMLLVISLVACTGGGSKDSAVGYYVVDYAKQDDMEFTGEELKEIGAQGYAILNEGGKGYLSIEGDDAVEIEWGDGKFTAEGESIDYTMDGDTITIEIEGIVLRFKRSNETPPEIK